MAGGVGSSPGFEHQGFPVFVGQPAIVPIRSGVFPPVIKKTDVVILLFQGLYFLFNKIVQFFQIIGNFLWDIKIHLIINFIGLFFSKVPFNARPTQHRT